MNKKSQHLTIYLLKDDVGSPDEALSETPRLRELQIDGNTRLEGAVFYKKSKSEPPDWADYIQAVVSDDLRKILKNQHSSLVLFVKASSRYFAVVFGYGRSLLKPGCYVRDFGLKVVLNAVDPDKLRCIDTNTLEEIPVATRQQASRVSALELFDIDRETEMMRTLVGKPRQGLLAGSIGLGNNISGSAALSLGVKADAQSLAKLCGGLLALYKRKDYKKAGFDWVDNLRPISDPARIAQLDEKLLCVLKKGDNQAVHLAPPEVIEWGDVEGIRYSTDRSRKRPLFGDIDIADFYSVTTRMADMTREDLLRVRVTLKYADSPAHKKQYRLYDCIVFDTADGGNRYVLADGLWFEIDGVFARKIDTYIGRIPEATIKLPKADSKVHQREEVYTAYACSGNPGYILMDQKMIVPTGARTTVEACDIYTRQRQFVHIKPYKGSSTLSHLFSQGTVSADLFQNDPGFRKRAKELVAKESDAVAKTIPLKVDPRNYEIVYAVIKKQGAAAPWQKSLPFFAKLNLRQASVTLRNRGYKVSVKLIPRE